MIARKFLVLFVAVWFPPTTSMPTRCVLLEILILLALLVTCASRPHTTSTLNTLDIATQFTSLVSVYLAAYVDSFYHEHMTGHGGSVATVCFLLINLLIFLVHLYLCWRPAVATFRLLVIRLRAKMHDCTQRCTSKQVQSDAELACSSPRAAIELSANPIRADNRELQHKGDRDIETVVFNADRLVTQPHSEPKAASESESHEKLPVNPPPHFDQLLDRDSFDLPSRHQPEACPARKKSPPLAPHARCPEPAGECAYGSDKVLTDWLQVAHKNPPNWRLEMNQPQLQRSNPRDQVQEMHLK